MHGNPELPSQPSWGGQFSSMATSPYRISMSTAIDTIPVKGIWELRLPLPKTLKKSKQPAIPFTLDIGKQQWQASYDGGYAVVRYAPKAPATLFYQIHSDIPAFDGLKGTLVATDQWPGDNTATSDIVLGSHWYTLMYRTSL